MKKKILLIAHNPMIKTKNFFPRGGENSMREICEMLSNKYDIKVLQFDNFEKKEKINGITYITKKTHSLNLIKKNKIALNLVKKNNFCAVMSWSHEGKIGNNIKNKFNIPHFYFIRRFETTINGNPNSIKKFESFIGIKNSPYRKKGMFIKNYLRYSYTFLNDIIIQNNIKNTFKNADVVFANSNYTKKAIKKVYNKDSLVIYPFVNWNKVKANKKGKYITIIGKNSNYEEQELVKTLAKKFPNEIFFSVGKVYDNVKNIKSKSEYFDNVSELYSKTKILLRPKTIPEPFGRVPLEGAISGIPSLATDLGAHKESVGNGGILIKPNSSIKEWVVNLNKILENYDYYSKKAKENYKYVDKLYKKQYKDMKDKIDDIIISYSK